MIPNDLKPFYTDSRKCSPPFKTRHDEFTTDYFLHCFKANSTSQVPEKSRFKWSTFKEKIILCLRNQSDQCAINRCLWNDETKLQKQYKIKIPIFYILLFTLFSIYNNSHSYILQINNLGYFLVIIWNTSYWLIHHSCIMNIVYKIFFI